MIIVWGMVECRSDSIEKAVNISLEHVRRSREEAGCIAHSVQISCEHENTLVFYEEWQDMETLQQHFSLSESKNFVETITQFSLAPPTMKIYSAEIIS